MRNGVKKYLVWIAPLVLFAPHGLYADFVKGKSVLARAEFSGCADDNSVTGHAMLRERPSQEGVKEVDVYIGIWGLSDGKHAVHIHERGVCEPCGDAGGHFDPGPFGETNPDANHPFHLGDLVNIKVKNGIGRLRVSTTRITLSPGPLSIDDDDGSAFIIHVNEDTYCSDGAEAGCAGGSRAACGIIKLVPSAHGDYH